MAGGVGQDVPHDMQVVGVCGVGGASGLTPPPPPLGPPSLSMMQVMALGASQDPNYYWDGADFSCLGIALCASTVPHLERLDCCGAQILGASWYLG